MISKDMVLGFLLGCVLCLVFLLLYSFKANLDSNPSIACSDTGKWIYIVDNDFIWISNDHGLSWFKYKSERLKIIEKRE